MKKLYTKEQLEYYFNELMKELNRVPTQKDINKASKEKTRFPSLSVFLNRFGTWQKAKEHYGKEKFNKRKCKYCGKKFVKKRKNQKFCSSKCRENFYERKNKLTWYKRKKIKKLLNNKCKLCDFDHPKFCKIVPKNHNERRRLSESDLVELYYEYKKSSKKKKKEVKEKLNENFLLLCPNHYKLWKNNLIEI